MWCMQNWKIKIYEKKAEGLLSNFGIKTLLNKIPLLGDILFWVYKNE